MKCLTKIESEKWLASFGVGVTADYSLTFAMRNRGGYVLRTDLSLGASRLMWFFSSIVDWLPNGCNRMLWLYKWLTYPPDQIVVFENLRQGCGEPRHIVDAPGHLFESSSYRDYESKTGLDIQEDGVLAAMALLMVSFDWEGYILTDSSDAHIFIGDEYLDFFSSDYDKIQQIEKIAKSYDLKTQVAEK